MPPGAGARVWINREGGWHPGVIICAAATAATVRFRLDGFTGTSVDTVHWPQLRERKRCDPVVDRDVVDP